MVIVKKFFGLWTRLLLSIFTLSGRGDLAATHSPLQRTWGKPPRPPNLIGMLADPTLLVPTKIGTRCFRAKIRSQSEGRVRGIHEGSRVLGSLAPHRSLSGLPREQILPLHPEKDAPTAVVWVQAGSLATSP